MADLPKVPAAVVYLERSDGRVLALTRGTDFSDWHMPGGKWEGPCDGGTLTAQGFRHDLAATAIREVSEETGVRLEPASLRGILSYTTRSGRPVVLFVAVPPAWVPQHFPRYPAGQPAWVPAFMLTLPSASFGPEAALVLRAVAEDRRRSRPSPFPAQAAAERGTS